MSLKQHSEEFIRLARLTCW